MCNQTVARLLPVEIVREIELDADADEVWEVVRDPDELAGWVGDEVRGARFSEPEAPGKRALSWTWAPDGSESDVELTVTEAGPRTLVRVVERMSEPTARALVGSADRMSDALLSLELWALRPALSIQA
ncbi:MAG: hypothetical protein GEV08_19510 [Acidimicrobiia bacterium]|nr:hypothetical protein [Acidimicrobiia bacterium]